MTSELLNLIIVILIAWIGVVAIALIYAAIKDYRDQKHLEKICKELKSKKALEQFIYKELLKDKGGRK